MNKFIKPALDFDLTIFDRRKVSRLLLLLGAILSILWSVYFMYRVVRIPHQITTLEGAAGVHTWFFLRGENPYTLENQPIGITLYGAMYNLVVLPFAARFGNTLAVHRAVNFVFILLSAAVFFFVVLRERRNHLSAPA